MKTTVFFVLLTVSSIRSFGQTNTFPSSGNVGIGTTSPTGKLTVAGVNYYNNVKFTGTSSNGIGISLENAQSGGHKFALFSSGSNNV